MIQDIDITQLVDKLMPRNWKCPHCGRRNVVDIYANECLIEHLKGMRHCEACGYVHLWTLKLTEAFKKRVVENLLKAN